MYFDISESFHSNFTIIRLYFAESLKGISMTPSSVPIFSDSNVFTIIDLGMDASIRGMHIEFFTIDIFCYFWLFVCVSLYNNGVMFYIDFGVLLITEINFPNDDAYNVRAVKSPDLLKK